MSPRTSFTSSAVAAATSSISSPCTSSAPCLPRLERPSSESPAKGVTPVSGQSRQSNRTTLNTNTPSTWGDGSGRGEAAVRAGTIAVPRIAGHRPMPGSTERRWSCPIRAIATLLSDSTSWPQQAPVPDWSQQQRAGSLHGSHPSAADRRGIAGLGSDGDPRRGDDDRHARGAGPGTGGRQVEANAADDRTGTSHRLRAALALALVLLLAACAEPSKDNVSPVGPSTTTTAPESTITEPGQPREVGRWSGSTSTDTENITVKESWELHWKITGDGLVSVQWLEPGDVLPDGSRTLNEPEGSTLIRGGGTFYLSIGAYGPSFEVWAVDVPN